MNHIFVVLSWPGEIVRTQKNLKCRQVTDKCIIVWYLDHPGPMLSYDCRMIHWQFRAALEVAMVAVCSCLARRGPQESTSPEKKNAVDENDLIYSASITAKSWKQHRTIPLSTSLHQGCTEDSQLGPVSGLESSCHRPERASRMNKVHSSCGSLVQTF